MAGTIIIPAAPQRASAERGVVDLWKAIKPLTTVASAMNTGAHPDDEHSATLAYLSLGMGVDTYSVIANRGEGGQNEIGSELGNALGIIRTRELQEASKITNVTLSNLSQKLNDPIYDFGFSKSPDETLAKWGEDVAYERLIRQIREKRPDVLIPAFLNEPSTHGHHRAVNVLTERAFKDAGNPKVFPQQLEEGLEPWQPKKLYVPASDKSYDVALSVGEYNEVYGASYSQLGEESRYMHKSQGMGRQVDEGQGTAYYKLQGSADGKKQSQKTETTLFGGIAFTFEDLAQEIDAKGKDNKVVKQLKLLQKDTDEVIAAYPKFAEVAREVHEMKADVKTTIDQVKTSSLEQPVKSDLLHRLEVKEKQLNKASQEATSVVVKVKPETGELVPGQTTKVTVTAYNGGSVEISGVSLKLNVPEGWSAKAVGAAQFGKLGKNQTVKTEFEVTVPKQVEDFNPYAAPMITADIGYEAFGTAASLHAVPDNAVAVLPPVALSLSPEAAILNTLKPEEAVSVKITATNYAPGEEKATVSLKTPEGWTVEPAVQELSFTKKNETKAAEFSVKVPANVKPGSYSLAAIANDGKSDSSRTVQVIQYPHIGKTYYVKPANLTIQAFDLKVPQGLKVGYVSSGFDNIDQVLRQVGVNVTNLDAKAIQFGDLSQYDTIVLGIRAYAFRPELIPSNQRLLDYAKNGGNLVVQYHKPEDKWTPNLAPYPIKIGEPLIEWRVTDENSKVTMLAPEHPIFNAPNKITDADWQNWIQDRSAYNPSEWGKEYTQLISNGDPGEKEFTGTFLTANYGKGTYTYSSLVWYREMPNLVPGSIRMFVNMISLKQSGAASAGTAASSK
ncbi:NEW3 domain-containing protein [Paenibacillus sp. KQZ6P-2]|uniref:NEW3 domain-containing protein n=1 Tax=Paenibacillus mangrovi TaxID=2931978 RepID=A0A9X1WS85_9BACL|nr:NEW3 domain-containing protein [Paenibacillus mangrovi]MCJ8014124.1 NEW3 domain-containing protein [Paenibacillus mangrovi]